LADHPPAWKAERSHFLVWNIQLRGAVGLRSFSPADRFDLPEALALMDANPNLCVVYPHNFLQVDQLDHPRGEDDHPLFDHRLALKAERSHLLVWSIHLRGVVYLHNFLLVDRFYLLQALALTDANPNLCVVYLHNFLQVFQLDHPRGEDDHPLADHQLAWNAGQSHLRGAVYLHSFLQGDRFYLPAALALMDANPNHGVVGHRDRPHERDAHLAGGQQLAW
jgi:hypothetical protein